MCTGCRNMFPKSELIRVVKTPEGTVLTDSTGKLCGRGAYICKNPECFRKIRKSGALSRALDTAVGEEIYDKIAKEINAVEQ